MYIFFVCITFYFHAHKFSSTMNPPILYAFVLFGANKCHPSLLSKEANVRRMNTSVKLNEMIRKTSEDAALVIVNLPSPPKIKDDEKNCILYALNCLVVLLLAGILDNTVQIWSF